MYDIKKEVALVNKLQILDCTLRDGGYCNQWEFGFENTRKIINGLVEANVDIIECGFLTNKVDYDKDITKYTSVYEVAEMIPQNRDGKLFVCMLNYGEYRLEDIPIYDGSTLDGLRIAFHKKDLLPALELCKGIKDKGYKVFVQPMVSLNYSDEEFLNIIRLVNEIEPYSFYIVDSFGVMKRKELIRLFYMVEHNLNEQICIGYHSHNNMQLAYSNAQALVDIRSKRDMIIDSSVFGMGRGAGNLNTELFVEYLNDNLGTAYRLKSLLTIIDEILNPFHQKNYWGYSLPNYLSAAHNIHPNYAGYLDEKKTLTIENMDEIFSMMDDAMKINYEKAYIEDLYIKYMATGHVQEAHLSELKERIMGKKVLLIAPGRSSIDEEDKVIAFANREDVISFSINFEYGACDTDFIFLSNLRRFRELEERKRQKCIVTSNIPAVDVYLQTNYKELLNTTDAVRDNAGMMFIKYLIHLGVKEVNIAGIDGYSTDSSQNFVDQHMSFITKKATLEAMNYGMNKVLREFNKQIEINFITTPKYVII